MSCLTAVTVRTGRTSAFGVSSWRWHDDSRIATVIETIAVQPPSTFEFHALLTKCRRLIGVCTTTGRERRAGLMQFVPTLASFPIVSLLAMNLPQRTPWQSRRRQERAEDTALGIRN